MTLWYVCPKTVYLTLHDWKCVCVPSKVRYSFSTLHNTSDLIARQEARKTI